MTRTLDASVTSYMAEPVLEFRVLADIAFVNSTMRLHTGVGSLMVGASHYDGIGMFGGVEQVSESVNELMAPVKLWLSLVDSVALSSALNEQLFNRAVVLRRCWLRNGTLVNTPEEWYRGVIGQVDVVRGDPQRGNFIEATCQTKLDKLRQPSYYTKEDLWLTYSGDTFFNYLHVIPTFQTGWGNKAVTLGGLSGNTAELYSLIARVLGGRR